MQLLDLTETRELCAQYISSEFQSRFPDSDFSNPMTIFSLFSPSLWSKNQTINGNRYIVRKTLVTPGILGPLLTELQIYKKLPESPYIATLLYADIPLPISYNDEYNYAHFVFKDTNSADLYTLIYERHLCLPFKTLKKILNSILKAILFLSHLGLVHGDIKPQNIILNLNTCEPQLIDFNSACPVGTTTTLFRGTREYSTPKHRTLLEQTSRHGFLIGKPTREYKYTTYDDIYAFLKMIKRDCKHLLSNADKIRLYRYRMKKHLLMKKGGACPCQFVNRFKPLDGGYRATKRDLKYLKKWRRGESIGFTMRSSLKAKGLIPRANGTRRVSKKYR